MKRGPRSHKTLRHVAFRADRAGYDGDGVRDPICNDGSDFPLQRLHRMKPGAW
jgi:hypothetical protein